MFTLSPNTSVDVHTSQFNTEKYLQFKRTDGKRWVNLSWSSWKKLKSLMPEVTAALEDEKSYRSDFYSTFAGSQGIVTEKYKDRMYVGIHYFDKSGDRKKGRGLNLIPDEWMTLKELAPVIDQSLQPFPKGWEYSEAKRPAYAWINREDGAGTQEGSWTFSVHECYEDALKYIPGLTPMNFKMKEKEVILPSARDLLVMCYTRLVQKEVQKLIKCVGCEVDHPSQKHHLDGCLMDQENAVLLYEKEARENICMSGLLHLYLKVREELKVPVVVTESLENLDEEGIVQKAELITDMSNMYIEVFDRLIDIT